uniref:Uncharacterized protein n=1 Tax=Arundo donax TaxID=35708 RepID=A0A0A9B643_ARUDO
MLWNNLVEEDRSDLRG